MTHAIKQELMTILACPKCRTAVKQDGDHLQCQNPKCRLRYPVRNGIPIMLIEEAKVAPA
jgi:uncharacterized protein YbaR (Trm112 family)